MYYLRKSPTTYLDPNKKTGCRRLVYSAGWCALAGVCSPKAKTSISRTCFLFKETDSWLVRTGVWNQAAGTERRG